MKENKPNNLEQIAIKNSTHQQGNTSLEAQRQAQKCQLEDNNQSENKIFFWLVLVLAATFITYAGALHHYFFLDDFWHILKASQTSFTQLLEPWAYSAKDYQSYWFANAVVNNMSVDGFFRPLVTICYWAGLHIWGIAPMPFHLLNIIGELLTVAIVFWIGFRLFNRGWAAGFCAAVFALHPAQYATVEWIAANADVMLGLFAALSIASFIEYVRGVKHWRWFYTLTIVSLILALCSKEMAGVLPGVYFGAALLFGRSGMRKNEAALGNDDSEQEDGEREDDRKNDGGLWRRPTGSSWRGLANIFLEHWKGFLTIVLLVLAYGLWRIPSAIGIFSLHTTGDYTVHLSSFSMLPQVLLNFSFYIAHFILLYPIWPMNFSQALGVNIWWIAPICIVVVIVAFWALAKVAKFKKEHQTISNMSAYWFGIWWIVIVLLPFCVLVPMQRLAHLPSIGFAIALTALATGLSSKFTARNCQIRLRVLAIALLTVYAGLTTVYVSMMGDVSHTVKRIVLDLDQQVQGAPKGSEIYVINLWQPAWMFEHLFEVKYAKDDYHIHVLNFSPNMLPMMMRQDPGAVQKWFATWFPRQAAYKPVTTKFSKNRTFDIQVKNGLFFHGLVEGELPVAPQAQEAGNVIDAGSFTATSLGKKDGAISKLKFHWKKQDRPPNRIFVKWAKGHWKRLTPPEDW